MSYETSAEEYATKQELQKWNRAGFTREAIEILLRDRQREYSNAIGKSSLFAKLYRENIQLRAKLFQESMGILEKLKKSLENYTGLHVILGTICLERENLNPYRQAYPDACVFSLFIPVENEFFQLYFLTQLKPNTQGDTHES